MHSPWSCERDVLSSVSSKGAKCRSMSVEEEAGLFPKLCSRLRSLSLGYESREDGEVAADKYTVGDVSIGSHSSTDGAEDVAIMDFFSWLSCAGVTMRREWSEGESASARVVMGCVMRRAVGRE